MISEVMISDVSKKPDTSRFGNQSGTTKQHYLIQLAALLEQDIQR